MMTRMFGFCCCCATAGVLAAVIAAIEANKPSQRYLAILMLDLLPRLPMRAGGLRLSARIDARRASASVRVMNPGIIPRGHAFHGERIGCRLQIVAGEARRQLILFVL